MNPQKRYRCERCEDVYEFYSSARECCQPEVEDCYICEKCGDDYDDFDAAKDCCADTEQEELSPEAAWLKNYQQIEAAGQQKLF